MTASGPHKPVTLKERQGVLRPEEVLLEFVLAEPIQIRSTGQIVKRIPPENTLRDSTTPRPMPTTNRPSDDEPR